MKTPPLRFLCLLLLLTAYESIAQITISQPAAGALLPVCTNYTLYYHPTSSPFSTYVVVEVHQNNSSGPVVKTYSNATGSMYLAQDYNNSMSASGLSTGNYQIKIYDYYNPSVYGWSGIFSISNLAAPASIGLIQNWGNSFEMNWATVPGATEYRVDVSTTSDFSSLLSGYNNHQATGTDPWGFYVTGLTPGATYYARVRAANSCSTSGNSPTLTVGCNTPAAPTATAATNITPTSFVAHWNAVSGAGQYTVTITKSGGSPQTYTTSSTSYTYTSAQPVSNYTYTVKAYTCNYSAESNMISVHTTLGVPVFGTSGGDEDERWTTWSSVTGAAYYHFQVSTWSNFSTIWSESEDTDTNETFDAYMCNTYYLRVRAKSAGGEYGPFSPVWEWGPSGLCGGGRIAGSDETDKPSIVTSVEDGVTYDGHAVSSYPNPAENSIRIRLPKPVDAKSAGISVIDLSGRKFTLNVQPFNEGLELDTSVIPKGFYIVSIIAGKERYHSKFIRK